MNRPRMLSLLNQIGERMSGHGRVAEIAVYGGSALVLQFDFREATRDVDYIPVRCDNDLLKRVSAEVGGLHRLPDGWFSDAMRLNPLSERGQTTLLGDFPSHKPGLRVFVAQPEYIFAMKMLAMRSSLVTKDVEDIWNLWDHLSIASAAEAVQVCRHYYPSKQLPQRHLLLLADIEDAKREGLAYSPRFGY